MVIPLPLPSGAYAVCHHGSTLAEISVHTQKVFGVYWLGVRMHLNGRHLIVDGRILSINRIVTMAATCVHYDTFISTSRLNSHPRGYEHGYLWRSHPHRAMCHNYDKGRSRRSHGMGCRRWSRECRPLMSRIGSDRFRIGYYGLQLVVKKTLCV